MAELVESTPSSLPKGRIVAIVLGTAPIVARIGWWWWNQGRQRTLTALSPVVPVAAIERTEVEMVRRTLGRWRVRVVSTRWAIPPTPVLATSVVPSARGPRWLVPVLRITALALEHNSRSAAAPLPRLPTPSGRLKP